ncbi:MAG: glycosyltransferase family 4 protein [Actinomycetota bacterium]
MRIVSVTREFPSISETFIGLRFGLLLSRGWDAHVLCERSWVDPWSGYADVDEQTVRHRIHVAGSARARADLLAELAPAAVHVEWGTLVSSVIAALPPDRRPPLLVSFQGYDICYAGLESEPGAYDDVWRSASAIHFSSQDLLDRALQRGMPSDLHAEVITPLTDLSAFVRLDDAREVPGAIGTTDRPLRLLTVSRLHWKKGFEYSLRAIAILRERGIACEFRIVGGGDAVLAIEHACRRLGLSRAVNLLGALAPAAVREQMLWADIALVSSVSEGFCVAALEAQAMRLPVVASDAEGLRENVADGVTGFIVPKRNPRAIADRLEQLVTDADLRRRLAEAGPRHAAERFDPVEGVARFERLYHRVASRKLGR